MVGVGHCGPTLKDLMLCFLLHPEQKCDSASSLAATNRRAAGTVSRKYSDNELESCDDAYQTPIPLLAYFMTQHSCLASSPQFVIRLNIAAFLRPL